MSDRPDSSVLRGPARGLLRRRAPSAWTLLALVAAPAIGSTHPQSEPTGAPVLEVRGVGTTDGHATLAWAPAPGSLSPGSASPELEFELVWAPSDTFASAELRYRGPDRASFRSGLTAGVHHYRVRQRAFGAPEWGPWSAPASVEIRPYAIWTAWSLFALGAFLVGSILVFLVRAERRTRSAARPVARSTARSTGGAA